MDRRLEHKGASFVWDMDKARRNQAKHGIRFEQAVEAFFDPFLRVAEAGRNAESRDAVIGHDGQGRLLYVVHLLLEADAIRIVSARKATREERDFYDS
ncbi:MAG: BrnT family toxin [Pseudomonas sp.]